MNINIREGNTPFAGGKSAKSLIAGAIVALSISGQAFAEGDAPAITVYGNLDTGIEYLTNVGAGKDTVMRIPGITGTMASRLGFKAKKDVGDGYSAFAVMEMGFSPDDGDQGQGGRIFGRQLNFGMQTPAGRFTIGRQYSPFLFATGDLMGPNIYALGSLDAYLPNARMDNSVSWSNKFGGNVSAALAYSFGRDAGNSSAVPLSGTCSGEDTQAADSSACKQVAASLKYKGDGFSLAFGIDKQNGGTGAKAYFFNGMDIPGIDMSDSGDTDTRTTVSGSFNLGDATIGLGVLNRKLDAVAKKVESSAVYVSAKYKASPKTTINAGLYNITNDDQDADATLAVVRAIYNIDKGVDWYTQIGSISNSSNARYALSPGATTGPAAGESQTGVMVGFRYIY
jgi:predicted porin